MEKSRQLYTGVRGTVTGQAAIDRLIRSFTGQSMRVALHLGGLLVRDRGGRKYRISYGAATRFRIYKSFPVRGIGVLSSDRVPSRSVIATRRRQEIFYRMGNWRTAYDPGPGSRNAALGRMVPRDDELEGRPEAILFPSVPNTLQLV